MPARQVSDVLDAIRDVHRQLAVRYRELYATAEDERLQLLLHDMQQREKKYDHSLREYESGEAKAAILRTWLQFVPEEAVQIDQIAVRLAQPRSLSELVEETLVLNARLCDAYRAIASEAPTAEVRELFTNLARLEEENDCHYAKVMLGEL